MLVVRCRSTTSGSLRTIICCCRSLLRITSRRCSIGTTNTFRHRASPHIDWISGERLLGRHFSFSLLRGCAHRDGGPNLSSVCGGDSPGPTGTTLGPVRARVLHVSVWIQFTVPPTDQFLSYGPRAPGIDLRYVTLVVRGRRERGAHHRTLWSSA